MKRKIKTGLKQVICFLLMMGLSGCWNSRELDTLGIVMGMGVDISEKEPDMVQFTAQLVKPGEIGMAKNGGSGGKAFWNVTSMGETVFAAVREATGKSNRKLYFPHNEIVIFGRDTAEKGIQKYLDFFERDQETRGKVLIAVSDTSAEELLSVKSELGKIPATSLLELIKGYAKETSQTQAVRLTDYEDNYMSGITSGIMPILKLAENGEGKTASVSGTAVFKEDKMVGELNKTEGRGLMWVLGKVKSGIIVVKDSQGDPVSCEIIRATGKIKPILENGKPVMKIFITEEGDIGEETGTKDLTELSEVRYLEEQIGEAIRGEVTAALVRARALNADIFGFGGTIKGKYPKQWKDMEKDWDKLFKTLEVELSVEVGLRLIGNITKAYVPEGE